MLIQPGRIFAATTEEAIKSIRAKYGTGELAIYPAQVQPMPGMTWWEFYIVLPDSDGGEFNDTG